MTTRVKRTYNLSAETVRHVRELASDYGAAETQDAVVELAVDRLYREQLEKEEAERWAAAAQDPDFRREMQALREAWRDDEWPR